MNFVSPALWHDTSLFCATAYGENGQADYVTDAGSFSVSALSIDLVLRTNSLRGGSWMITAPTWNAVRVLWPKSDWVDWAVGYLHEKSMACLRPEVPRAVTFGEAGINKKRQVWCVRVRGSYYWDQQKKMVLNRFSVDFSSMDASYLVKVELSVVNELQKNYDGILMKMIEEATELSNVDDLVSLPVNSYAKLVYSLYCSFVIMSRQKPGNHDFFSIASKLGIASDATQGLLPSAYMGIVTIGFHGIRLFIVPEGGMIFDN